MKSKNKNFTDLLIFFAAGFFVGLFVKFLPYFIVSMLLFLAAGGIYRCFSR